jgi:UDP-glucose 4-epimerase
MNPVIPMSEDATQVPESPYGRTKLAVEWMIRDFAHAYGIGFTLLRYFNAAGADKDGNFGQDHSPFTHIIPIVLQVVLGQREQVQVFGDDYPTEDGTCIRDYVHTEDLAQAHLAAIKNTNEETSEVFNIGTGVGNSVLEIISACEKVTGTEIKKSFTKRRPGDPAALVADPSKLKAGLGWEPRYTDILEIVETAWRWHRSHPNGYQGTGN